MNEYEMKQLFAELIEAQGQALGLVVTALCQQVDAKRLQADLKKTLESAKTLHSTSPLALRIATNALAAADAEKMLQGKSGAPSPDANPLQPKVVALNVTLDALMSALPAALQEKWLTNLRTLATSQEAAFLEQGSDPETVRQVHEAIARRWAKLGSNR